MLALLAFGAGIYLGLHFNILALLPFSGLGAGAYIVLFWAAGRHPVDGASQLIMPLLALEVGYFFGLIARDLLDPCWPGSILDNPRRPRVPRRGVNAVSSISTTQPCSRQPLTVSILTTFKKEPSTVPVARKSISACVR